ncbi:MAG TPA: hypothetical protein VEA99_09820 [Gemmatimonadaceae bacterium]|nr:hypothetical protein [Gemmatimonadaceae bacterium]
MSHTPNAMFNISALNPTRACDQAQPMTLRHPNDSATPVLYEDPETGERKPIRIWLLGNESSEAKRLRRELTRERMRRNAAKSREEPTDAELDESIERIELEDARLAAALTVRWEGILVDGVPVDCTPARALALYQQEAWVGKQAERFVLDLGHYMGDAVGNSRASSLPGSGTISGSASEAQGAP